jgi:type II secretory pathway pseudopilin PulG
MAAKFRFARAQVFVSSVSHLFARRSSSVDSTPTLCRAGSAVSHFPHRQRGFTLIDTGLLVLCLGLAGFIAVSEIGKLRQRMKRDAFVSDLRQIAGVLEKYHAQKGEWPGATSPESRVPRGLEAELGQTRWSAGSPFGGTYQWVPPPKAAADASESKAAAPGILSVTAFSPDRPLALTRTDLREIDQKIDDGNLGTGRFQSGFNGWPVWQVSPGR